MITLYDHIQELRAELRSCYFTRRERAALQADLANAIAEQAELDRAFDAALEALSNPLRTSGPPRERPLPFSTALRPASGGRNMRFTCDGTLLVPGIFLPIAHIDGRGRLTRPSSLTIGNELLADTRLCRDSSQVELRRHEFIN